MKKMLFIYNPKAGKAQIRNKLADILDVFTKGGYEITVYPTQKSEDAMEKTRDRSKDYDIVVCSGGDGTLDEVVTGMIRSGFRTPIGYIAAFGLFTDVSYETGQDMKNVLGHMAYLLEGMKRLPAIRSYPMRVTYDDTTIDNGPPLRRL